MLQRNRFVNLATKKLAVMSAVLFFSVVGIYIMFLNNGVSMPNRSDTKTVIEIKTAAGKAASKVLPDETAETFPLPVRFENQNYLQILYYREAGAPGERVRLKPDHCMLIDPYTAAVVKFWPCAPEEIGIMGKKLAINPPGMKPDMTADEYTEKEETLMILSPFVWQLYFKNTLPTDQSTIAKIQEYRTLFLEISNKEEAAWVIEASSDFFEWIDAVIVHGQ